MPPSPVRMKPIPDTRGLFVKPKSMIRNPTNKASTLRRRHKLQPATNPNLWRAQELP